MTSEFGSTDSHAVIDALDSESWSAEESIVLCFRGTDIAIRSTDLPGVEAFHDLEAQVTGMTASVGRYKLGSPSLLFEPTEDTSIEYLDGTQELIITGPTARFEKGTAVSHTAGYMAECVRAANNGVMLVHAAAVTPPNTEHAIVIFGEKGAGKTNTALRLCYENNFGLVGNDQIFLGLDQAGSLIAEGGDDYFLVRETAVNSDEHLAALLQPYQHGIPAWINKTRLNASEIGVPSIQKRLPLKGAYHIRIDGTQDEFYAQEWHGLQRSLFLHEKIGRHITGQATPFLDDNGAYMGSLPAIELARASRNRDRLVRALGGSGIVSIYSPDANQAIEYILQKENK